jgi:pSer/pThr/pTyr-binding forkhead associated (FHA) protein
MSASIDISSSADSQECRGSAVLTRATAAPGQHYLLVLQGESSTIVPVPACGTLIVGRGPEASLRVRGATVSRRHATISKHGDVVQVTDLGSHNGTRLNGQPVTGPVEIVPGDAVSVGGATLVLRLTRARPRI